jgi:hypothetical protein
MRLLPIVALLLFFAIDALANWRMIPARTVSESVWSLGWVGRLGAGALLAVLFGHLVLQWPFGPIRDRPMRLQAVGARTTVAVGEPFVRVQASRPPLARPDAAIRATALERLGARLTRWVRRLQSAGRPAATRRASQRRAAPPTP